MPEDSMTIAESIDPNIEPSEVGIDTHPVEESQEDYFNRIWTKIEDTMLEASEARRAEEQEWERWLKMYLGEDWRHEYDRFTETMEESTFGFGFSDSDNPESLPRYSIPKTQTAIISNTAGETKDPVAFRWEPVEAGHPEMIFLRARARRRIEDHLKNQAAQAVMAGMVAHNQDPALTDRSALERAINQRFYEELQKLGFSDAQWDGYEPLLEESGHFDVIDNLLEAGAISEDDIIRVNDIMDSEVAQTIWDALFERANGDQHVLINIMMRSIIGHQWVRIQWNNEGPKKNTFSLENVHPLNVWCDTTHQLVEDMDYLHFDHVISLDEAIARFPQAQKLLEEAASDNDNVKWGSGLRRGSLYSAASVRRPMVIVRTSWLRHQEVPMTIDEAVKEGLVRYVQPTEAVIDENGAVVQEATEGGWEVLIREDDNGESNIVPSPQVVRERWEPTSPPDDKTGRASPNWPTTFGILQVVSLPDIQKVLDVRRNPYLDIPFALNINIFRPFTPYGEGEPHRLEDISDAIDNLITILSVHIRNFPFPQTYMRQSTFKKLSAMGISFHLEPGQIVPVPDEEYEHMVRHGRASLSEQAPSVPEGYFRLLDQLLKLHDEISGNVEVQQGRVPFSGASGKLIENLITQATGPLAMRSRFTEFAWERIAREAMHCIVKFMDTDAIAKIVSNLPRHVLEIVLKRLGDKEYNIRVETYTGKGVNRLQQQGTALALYDRNLLDDETTLEQMRWPNPKAVMKRKQEALQAQMGMAAQGQPQGQPQ